MPELECDFSELADALKSLENRSIYKLPDLINLVNAWFTERGMNDPIMQYAKLNDGVGEIAHELTRGKLDTPELKDAIGDTIVTIIGLCHHLNLDFTECLEVAYHEIKDRKGKVVNGSFVKDK